MTFEFDFREKSLFRNCLNGERGDHKLNNNFLKNNPFNSLSTLSRLIPSLSKAKCFIS